MDSKEFLMNTPLLYWRCYTFVNYDDISCAELHIVASVWTFSFLPIYKVLEQIVLFLWYVKLTNCMERSHWEGDSFLASQGISNISQNPQANYYVK
jgi:hypothetical protein